MKGNNITILSNGPKRWKYLNFIDYLLPVYLLLTIPLFYLGIDFGFIFKGAAIVFILFYLLRFGLPQQKSSKIFIVFFFFVLFSFIQYAYNDRPFSCYIGDATNYLLSMSFFFIGVTDDRPGRTFYRKLVYAISITFSIGLVCYILTPSWYVSRVADVISQSSIVAYDETTVLDRMRFSAFWGDSYPVSHFSIVCIAISLFDIVYFKGREKIIAFLCFIVGLISSITSMHRAAIAGSIIALVLFFYYNRRLHKSKNNIWLLAIIAIIILVLLVLGLDMGDRIEAIVEMITNRVDDNMSISKAYAERKNTKELLSSMTFYIFGHGLGSGGVQVRAFGYPGVSDMQYIKMFYENGIVGAFLFVFMIFSILRRGLKNIRYFLTDIAIILFFLFAMIGSNSLSLYFLYVVPFWYAAGRICNDNYIARLKTSQWI